MRRNSKTIDMKTKPGFKLRTLGTDHILLAEGVEQINFNKMVAMNQSAAFLWENVEGKEFSADSMTELLTSHYDVSEDVARADVGKLIANWLEAGIIEE